MESKVIDAKTYPEAIYFARRRSAGDHQLVFKKLLPDGMPTELSLDPSQNLIDHSSEFNWGYSGSGPAQLALALLLDATTDPEMALANYQYFKSDKVAGWGDQWSILRSDILLWIEQQKKAELEAMLSRN